VIHSSVQFWVTVFLNHRNLIMIKNIARILISSYILLCTIPAKAAVAPVAPDSGQTMRELEKKRELSIPKATIPLKHSTEPEPKAEGVIGDIRMLVNSIRVTGNTVISSVELEGLLADLVGGEHSLAELNDAAARITAYYHEQGYIVSRAYIPPQEIKDGVVMISVQEGRIGKLHVDNQSRLSDEVAGKYFSVIRSGDVLQAGYVERAILLLNETPGVGVASAILRPGTSIGSADVVVELPPSVLYSANIQVDNYGNYFTGENRLGAELAINSPLMLGDMLTLRALGTDKNLTYGYLAYQVPVGGSGLRIGATNSGTSYSLDNEFVSLKIKGKATIGSIFALYPFIRTLKNNLAGTLTLEDKQFKDDFVPASVTTEKQVRMATIGLTFNHLDNFIGGGATTLNISLAKGNLSLDDASLSIDKGSANTNGPFSRFNYTLNRLQRLSDRVSLWFSLSGQNANKNLNSSEQFSLGGAYGVRAYPQGEAIGDDGRLATLEIRANFTQTLQSKLFYDAGSVNFNHDPYLSDKNTRFISGGGVGVNAKVFGVDINAILALRGSGGQPSSEPLTTDRKSRWWLQVGKNF